MAFAPLLLRRFSFKNPNFHSRISYLIAGTRTLWFSDLGNGNRYCFSTSQSSLLRSETDLPKVSDPKASLSARMSFVFDQIDAMERERDEKDEALQRIRSWRQSRKEKVEEESSKLGDLESVELKLSSEETKGKKGENMFKKEVEVVHPWPEWVELMERLVQQNYFDHRRTDEDKMMQDLSIDVSGFSEEGFDFTRDWTTVRTACLNFGRDRFDILKSLSRHDIQILVGYGCPSTDKKVVFSAKVLRKHVHLDEGDVCSSCSLRSSCEKAYLLSRKEDEARTLDVVRVLLTYGFDPINGSVENKSLLKLKSVKTVVRKLLHEVVKLSAVPIDPNLPPPVIKKPPPKVKQPPPPPKRRVGRDDIEMKKGDWLCPKCDFMNFAKNTVCLQCDAKRPKRQLLPGEWECPECNFLNYRRNMACFHCDHKRPPDEFVENHFQSRPSGSKTRLEKVADVPGVSNAWNFDFDDNESDGADVAAFEYADPPRFAEDTSMENHAQTESTRGFEVGSFETSQLPRTNGRGRNSNLYQRRSGTGFDDFDDEEDDDINSYEIDTSHDSPIRKSSSKDFSQAEGFSDSEDFDISDIHLNARQGNARQGNASSHLHHKQSRVMPARADLVSEDNGHDFGSDEELSTYPNWKSSHIADSRYGTRSRGRNDPYREITFGSDDEAESISDSDDSTNRGFGQKQRNRDKWSSNGRSYRRADKFDSESNDEDDLPSNRNNMKGSKAGFGRRGLTSMGRDQFESARGAQFRSNSRTNNRRNSFGNAGLDRHSHRNGKGRSQDGYNGKSMDERRGNMRHFGQREGFGSRGHGYSGKSMDEKRSNMRHFGQREGFGAQARGKLDLCHDQSEMERDNRRRIIER